MIIFYNKQTGDVVGCVEGFGTEPYRDQMMVTIPGVEVGRLDIPLGHPQEELARRVENHQDQLTVFDLKFEGDTIREHTPAEKAAKKNQEEANKKASEAWAKANPPRDPLAEIDSLKNQIAALKANANKPATP